MARRHFLVVALPVQGHVNPALRFVERLRELGAHVTFATTPFGHRLALRSSRPPPEGMPLVAIHDGCDDGFGPWVDFTKYREELRESGRRTLSEGIAASREEGVPVTCIVYTILLPWAAAVAREQNIPSALLWIQPAAVFDAYYYYFNGYGEMIREKGVDPLALIELPGLPPFKSCELPSFLIPSNAYAYLLPMFEEQMEALDEETNPTILVNTYDALEPEALKAVGKVNMIGIGPLVLLPYGVSCREHPSQGSKDYLAWLNSKPESSVVYVSFGTIAEISKRQTGEIARGLLQCRRPFLWVVRCKQKTEQKDDEEEKEEDELTCLEELQQQGMIVPWCNQAEVLSHPSLGCFVSHCGWNSTLESLAAGVPFVAVPQWTDQATCAKLIEEVCSSGIRVSADGDGVVDGDELSTCLELVMGPGQRHDQLRNNANKWKDLAIEAVKEGGSSDRNLRDFVDKVAAMCGHS